MHLRGALIPAVGAFIFAAIGVESGLYFQVRLDAASHLFGPRIDVAEAATPQGGASAPSEID
jgi:hypothetical protein